MSDEWQELEGALVTWKEPRELVGEYRGFVEVPAKFGGGDKKEKKHRMFLDEGETVSFFAPTTLARMLEGTREGQRIKIVWTGETQPSKAGQPVKVFRVFVSAASREDAVETAQDNEVPF